MLNKQILSNVPHFFVRDVLFFGGSEKNTAAPYHPDKVGQLSSSKSPQQMFGAIAKTYFKEKLGMDPESVFCVSIMPCVAKKYECSLGGMRDAGEGPDVDVVLTTREVDRLIRAGHIAVGQLEEEEFDSPLGIATGAGVIFGTTGGVMEAALRSAYQMVTGAIPPRMRSKTFAVRRGGRKGRST